ncbi:hypothetical protein CYY_005094 [Polysphondylium violaceum]|uniref:Peptidase S59 domain-containing protein n=1 Tax=Polysphondylium violaceum TaxID=133409 RepID=A0A8J4UYU4_9MYCE|nr:hypothetical protein CYY_005094 [Polysphondylium violaceum]
MFGSSFGGFNAKPAASTPFGAPSTGSSLFGAPQPTSTTSTGGFGGFGGFGQPATSTTTTATSSPFGGFGQTTTPATSSPFSGFGSQPAAAPATSSPFGGFGQTTAAAPATSSPFGGFGQTTAAAPATSSPFGGMGGSAAPTSLFGTSSSSAGGFGGFGASATPATSSPFGGGTGTSLLSGQTTSSSPFGGFGQQTTTTTTSSPFGGFGGAPAASTSSPFGGFGGATARPVGTGAPPYTATQSEGCSFVSITAMDAYSTKSFEELRLEDVLNKKDQIYKTGAAATTTSPFSTGGATSSPFGGAATSTSPFGGASTTLGGTTSPFGGASTTLGGTSSPFGTSATTTSPFGGASTSSPFGGASSTSPFGGAGTGLPAGSSASPFGGATAGSSPFGGASSSPFGNTGTTMGGGSSPFGTTTNTSTSPFGATASSSPFGAAPSTTSPFGGGSLLSGATQPSSGLFPSSTATQTSLFNLGGPSATTQQTQSTSPFGTATQTSSSLFPSSTTSTPNSIFGGLGTNTSQSTASPFNNTLFGQQPSTSTSLGGTGLGLGQTSATPGLFSGLGATNPSTVSSTSLFPSTTTSTQPSLSLGGGTSLWGAPQTSTTAQPSLSLGGGLGLGLGQTNPTSSFSLAPSTTFPSTSGSSLFPSSGGLGTGSQGGLGLNPSNTFSLSGTTTQPSNSISNMFAPQSTTTATPSSLGFGNTLGLGGLGTNTLGAFPNQNTLQVQTTQTPQLNNNIASQSPYYPIPSAAPLSNFVKSVTASQAPAPPPASSATVQRSLSHLSYVPKSSTKLVPRRGDLGFNLLPSNGTSSSTLFSNGSSSSSTSSSSSSSSSASNNNLFPIDKFITKHSKSLNINTTNETEDSLKQQQGNNSFPFKKDRKSNNNDDGGFYNQDNSVINYSSVGSNSTGSTYSSLGLPSNQYTSKTSIIGNGSTGSSINTSSSSTIPTTSISSNINNGKEQQQQPTTSTTTSSAKESKPQQQKPNPNAPRLTKEGYTCKPSIKELSMMSDKELSKVHEFTIERAGHGSVKFFGDADIRGLDLDNIVSIQDREISVYPDEHTKAPVGQGVNRPALVALERCWPTVKGKPNQYRKNPEDLNKYERALKKQAEVGEFKFVDYDQEKGVWRFTVEHFSKYSAPDDFDEDDVDQAVVEQQSRPITFQAPAPITSSSAATSSSSSTTTKPKFSANIAFESDVESDGNSSHDESDFIVPQKKYNKTPFIKRATTSRESGLFDEEPSVLKQNEESSHKVSKISSNPSLKVSRGPNSNVNVTSKSVYTIPPPTNFTVEPLTIPTGGAFKIPTSVSSKSTTASSVVPSPTTSSMEDVVVLSKPKIKIDSTILDRIVPSSESILKDYPAVKNTNQDPALFMRRSFRVGWAPGGRFITTSKGSLKKLIIHQIPTESDKKSKKDDILKFLSEHHSNSSLVPANQRAIGWFALSQVQNQIESQLTCSKLCKNADSVQWNDIDSYYHRIWSLISTLWGTNSKETEQFSMETTRKLKFNQWVKDVCVPLIKQDIEQLKKKPSSSYLDSIFTFLTGKQIKEASNLAYENKDFRFATMMSQVWSSDENGKLLLLKQIQDYQDKGIDNFINKHRIEILQLIAGDIDQVYKNVSDWIRCFALNFWFKFPLNSPLLASIENFEQSYLENKCKVPLPPYLIGGENNNNNQFYDICYLLIKLYASDRFDKYENIFYPQNIGNDLLDYYFSWNLYSVLKSIPSLNKQPDVGNQSLLHSSFAAQLERLGLWQWAIYVLLHTPDNSNHVREEAVKSLIVRYTPVMSGEDKSFLTQKLCIPQLWLDEAASWYMGYSRQDSNNEQQQLQQQQQLVDMLIKSHQYSSAHDIIFNSIGPKSVIQSKFYQLSLVLQPFLSHATSISSWRLGGAIFNEYCQINFNFQECVGFLSSLENQDELNYMKTILKLRELSDRISNLLMDVSKLNQSLDIKNTSDIYKIALSSISNNLLSKLILLKDIPSAPGQSTPLISTNKIVSNLHGLPLTQDFRSNKLESITNQIQDMFLTALY